MELLKTFLGGAGGAALVTGLFGLCQWLLNRKSKKADHAAADYGELLRRMEVLFLADRTILYDRIKYLGKSYIAQGCITVEDLEDLERMHSVYHDKDKLDGNGFLDDLMRKVRALPVRA